MFLIFCKQNVIIASIYCLLKASNGYFFVRLFFGDAGANQRFTLKNRKDNMLYLLYVCDVQPIKYLMSL